MDGLQVLMLGLEAAATLRRAEALAVEQSLARLERTDPVTLNCGLGRISCLCWRRRLVNLDLVYRSLGSWFGKQGQRRGALWDREYLRWKNRVHGPLGAGGRSILVWLEVVEFVLTQRKLLELGRPRR